MKNILIMSDSHGDRASIEKTLSQAGNIDYLFHLGDICGDESYLQENVECPLYLVSGNCDQNYELQQEQIVTIEGKKILLTHGDDYNVHNGYELLLCEAKNKEVDVVVYGHTHRPEIICDDGIWIINPGSVSRPRQADECPTYVLMSVGAKGETFFEVKKLV